MELEDDIEKQTDSFTRHLWAALAWVSLLLGIIGAFVPVLPTVPFILLSAYAAARGSHGLRRWLIAHPKFGSAILEWERDGTVRRRAKWLATLMMTASFLGSAIFSPGWKIPLGVGLTMLAIATWLWTRPGPLD